MTLPVAYGQRPTLGKQLGNPLAYPKQSLSMRETTAPKPRSNTTNTHATLANPNVFAVYSFISKSARLLVSRDAPGRGHRKRDGKEHKNGPKKQKRREMLLPTIVDIGIQLGGLELIDFLKR